MAGSTQLTFAALVFVFAIACMYSQQTDTTWHNRVARASAVVGINRCKRTLDVLQPALFAPHNRVLIHQARGAEVDLDNPEKYGHTVSLGSSGVLEWSVVDTVIANTVYLRHQLVGDYNVDHGIQLVKVFHANSATVSGTMQCMPWNGSSGGIVAVWCDSLLVLNGEIAALGAGFMGGSASLNTADTGVVTVSVLSDSGGSSEVGQGIGNRTGHSSYGMGSIANGGGGGNGRNAGGGGGGLGGAGGNGGAQLSDYKAILNGGRGGNNISGNNLLCNVWFGGGGGGGHQNDFYGSAAGNGGGAIVIRAERIVATERTRLNARGMSADTAYNDGGGGGGSGGTIHIESKEIEGTITTDASGGNGASTHGQLFAYGSGGGGGGGVVQFSSQSLANNILAIVGGGQGGQSYSTHSQSVEAHHGSAGTNGVVRLSTAVPIGRQTYSRIRMVALDTVVDFASSTTLLVSGANVVRWTHPGIELVNGRTDSVRTPSIVAPTWFVAIVITADGCTLTDSILVLPRKPVSESIIVSVDDAKGAPGDTVDLYLRVRLEKAATETISGTAYVRMRSRVLKPRKAPFEQTDTTVSIQMPFRLSAKNTSTFRREGAFVVLGDSSVIGLFIDSVVFSTAFPPLRINNGKFRITDICIDNGQPRLFDAGSREWTINGRIITTMADDIHVTDCIGKRVEINRVRAGTELFATIPDDVRGPIFISITSKGVTRTMGIILRDP